MANNIGNIALRITRYSLLFFVVGSILFEIQAFSLPIISNEELTSINDTSAVITWVTTNETSSSEVYYGVSSATTLLTTDESGTNYHYALLQGLSPGTTYKYYVKSGSATGATKAFTTLIPPSGQYLFSFATLADTQYGMGKADTTGARGRPYSHSREILDATVQAINSFSPAFTILKGDIIEDDTDAGDTPYGEYVNTTAIPGDTLTIKQKFDGLTKASDAGAKYYPIPGNHDKTTSSYTGGTTSSWYTKNLNPLYPSLTIADPTADSCFNYSFVYNGFRFIMLDSVKANITAEVNATFLTTELSAAQSAGQKCFIFLHHPITDIRDEGIPIEVIREVTGGTDDYSKIQITNTTEVQALITTYKNIIAGVFSGHIHDNNYSEISGVPCVRTSSGIQFPIGYDIYKVYSNGYMQSFYKVPTWTEIARIQVTPEAGYSDNYWEQFSLGPNNARNFSHTLSNIQPYISYSTPTSGATAVPINESITIKFTKAMNQTNTENAITISPDITKTFAWTASDTVVISHSSLSPSTTYTVSIGIGATDTGGTAIGATSFAFTTGAISDSAPPQAAFDSFSLDISSDNQPTITGIATDELSNIISIECRIDGGTWIAATPLDQHFNSKVESFYFKPTAALTRGTTSHSIEAKCSDAASNTNTTFKSYSFYIVGDNPEIGIKSGGLDIVSGDPIGKEPSFEVTVIGNNGLALNPLQASIDGGTAATLTKTVNPTNSGILTSIFNPSLADGTHTIKISIVDDLGNISTREIVGLVVQSAAVTSVQGTPLSFPNPYNGVGDVSISYVLSKNNSVVLTIHDLLGNQIVRKSFAVGTNGGKAGYNEVAWDGKSDSGEALGNGIYIYLIISDGTVLSKGKLTVVR